jgi:hypothetical protein
LRHLCVFLVFVGGVWALYRIAALRYEDWRWGLLAAGLLVLSPRFFAEAFYNGKDIVYMACFTGAIYTLLRLLRRPTLGRAIVHGLFTAVAVDVRVQGLLLIVVSLLMLGLEAAYWPRAELTWGRAGRVGAVYLGAALCFIVLGWPYLWALSWSELVAATGRISQYPWPGQVVYFGQRLPAGALPWHYIPVWIIISTPLLYILAAVVGLTTWAWQVVKKHNSASLSTFAGRLDWLFVAWLLVPVLLVIGLRSVVYDGWRHLYFIYPALLLFVVRGVQVLSQAARRGPQWRRLATAGALVGGIGLAHPAWRIIRDHPHQQVYFSVLPPSFAQTNFDLDYWGLSYRQGLEWVLAHDSAPTIRVSVVVPRPPVDVPYGEHLLYVNSLILPPGDRARLRFTDDNASADYILTTYRYQPQPLPASVGREVYSIQVNGVRILSVFRQSGK